MLHFIGVWIVIRIFAARNDNGDYVGTLDNFRLYALCLTTNEIDELFESVTTGIDFLQNEESQAAKGEWLDLSGRRISHPTQKGIFIINHKKWIRWKTFSLVPSSV